MGWVINSDVRGNPYTTCTRMRGSPTKSCQPYQAVKTGRKIQFPARQINVPDKRFSYINLVIVGPLTESHGYRYMLTILDRTSMFFQAVVAVGSSAGSLRLVRTYINIFSMSANLCRSYSVPCEQQSFIDR